MRCSASGMFASDNVNSCTCVIRKSIYSLTTRIFKSTNPIEYVNTIRAQLRIFPISTFCINCILHTEGYLGVF